MHTFETDRSASEWIIILRITCLRDRKRLRAATSHHCLFVLDLVRHLSSGTNYLLYADDLKVFRTIRSPSDSACLQLAIDGVSRRCEESGMILSPFKCMVLAPPFDSPSYSVNGWPLPTDSILRNLGVTIEHGLDSGPLVVTSVESAQTAINTIFLCFSVKNPGVYLRLYSSVVLSRLLYSSPV